MRLWTHLRCVVILAALLGLLASTTATESPTLSQEVEGLLHVVSLTGFEATQQYAISANDSMGCQSLRIPGESDRQARFRSSAAPPGLCSG